MASAAGSGTNSLSTLTTRTRLNRAFEFNIRRRAVASAIAMASPAGVIARTCRLPPLGALNSIVYLLAARDPLSSSLVMGKPLRESPNGAGRTGTTIAPRLDRSPHLDVFVGQHVTRSRHPLCGSWFPDPHQQRCADRPRRPGRRRARGDDGHRREWKVSPMASSRKVDRRTLHDAVVVNPVDTRLEPPDHHLDEVGDRWPSHAYSEFRIVVVPHHMERRHLAG
jgi:hypothetical protein